MVKLYNNKPKIDEPFNRKGLLFGLLVLSFLFIFSIAVYKSFGPDEKKANILSEVNNQYANVFQLKTTVFHPPNYELNDWAGEVKSVMLKQINGYCDVIHDSIQKPVINRVLHKDKFKLTEKRRNLVQFTARVEFECNTAPF